MATDMTDPALRRRTLVLAASLIAANLGLWMWAFAMFRHAPLLLGNALMAYGFGLRHAVDADHIASIDNVTRKLMQAGKRPLTVGLWFAIGHSAIVVLAAIGSALLSHALQARFGAWRDVGGIASTIVSAGFLFALALTNLWILGGTLRAYRRVRAGGSLDHDHLERLLNQRGLLARLLRPVFRLVSQSWHMVLLGFLFGLGFDTATEVSLLGLSASQAAHGVSLGAIMVFPCLFAAGMSLIDTADGVLMLGAYQWAFVDPLRKLRYNIAITLVSVLVAVVIGSIETLRLISDQFGAQGPIWQAIAQASDNFNAIGFGVIALFILAWASSVVVYRYGRPRGASPETS